MKAQKKKSAKVTAPKKVRVVFEVEVGTVQVELEMLESEATKLMDRVEARPGQLHVSELPGGDAIDWAQVIDETGAMLSDAWLTR